MAAMLTAAPASAQRHAQVEVEGRVIASDNPFLLSGGDTGAAAGELLVRPEVTWQLAPGTALELSGLVAYRRYTRRYGDFLTGRADVTAMHRDSEYLSFDTQFSYSRELPSDALTESIDFTLDSRSVRERWFGRSSAQWRPDEYTEVTGSAGWEKLRYPGSALLTSATGFNVDLGARRRVSERTWIGIQGSNTITRIATFGSMSAQAVRATISHRAGPAVQASGQIGIEWADLDTTSDRRRARLSGIGNVCYNPQRLEACLTASLQSEVSGFGGLQREFFVGATARRRVSERGAVTANAEYRTGSWESIDRRTRAMRLNAGYEHRLRQRLTLTGSVDYLDRTNLFGERNGAVVAMVGIRFGREDR